MNLDRAGFCHMPGSPGLAMETWGLSFRGEL